MMVGPCVKCGSWEAGVGRNLGRSWAAGMSLHCHFRSSGVRVRHVTLGRLGQHNNSLFPEIYSAVRIEQYRNYVFYAFFIINFFLNYLVGIAFFEELTG